MNAAESHHESLAQRRTPTRSTRPRVPPIPPYVHIDESEYNSMLRGWGVEEGPQGWARLYWGLQANAHHGWTIEHVEAFVRYNRLPAPDELEPKRVILYDQEHVRLQIDDCLLTGFPRGDELPYPAVRLLYGYRLTHYSTRPPWQRKFLNRMARYLGHSVEKLSYDCTNGALVLHEPAVLVYHLPHFMDARIQKHAIFGVRIIEPAHHC